MTRLLPNERFQYNRTLFTVITPWFVNQQVVRYDIKDHNGTTYTRSASVIHERIEQGAITFV